MKRSELNEIIREGEKFIASFGFKLPEFASWSMDDWKRNKPRAGEVIRARLGWDITDFGRGDFDNLGLLLFTVRNGNADNLKTGKGMVYAEKIMISRENQVTPFHSHRVKTEDIIVRVGARDAGDRQPAVGGSRQSRGTDVRRGYLPAHAVARRSQRAVVAARSCRTGYDRQAALGPRLSHVLAQPLLVDA